MSAPSGGQAAASEYDLVVIGGGINGAGIAHDAATRGLRVCLLEQADLCHGTSRWSSRLIHGGLRYLEHAEIGLVRESLQEREILLRVAAHLVRPLPLLVPIYAGARRGRFTLGAGMWLYDLLSAGKSLPRHRMLDAGEAMALAPALESRRLRGAAHYYDAQVSFPERLVLENALAARAAGATIHTRHRVTKILTTGGIVTGVLAVTGNDTGHDTGQRQFNAPLVINAAGPWVDQVLQGLPAGTTPCVGGTKGTHIVVRSFPGAPDCACYVEARSDGRPFFVIPWNGLLLIGTTDIRFPGDPSAVGADAAEIDYLLRETRAIFPRAGLDYAAVLYHYTGVRPLPPQSAGQEGAITRRHQLRHHADVARGLYTVIGGKLTTYRSLAEDVVDRVTADAGLQTRSCQTRTTHLPGAGEPLNEVARQLDAGPVLPEAARDHLLQVYGARATEVMELVKSNPELGAVICAESQVIAAEIPFAFEQEMATTLADVLMRRCMSGLSADNGRGALAPALAIGQRVLGWGSARIAEEKQVFLAEIAALRSGLDAKG